MKHDIIYRNRSIIFGPRKPKVTRRTSVPNQMAFYNWLITTTTIKFICASLGVTLFAVAIFVANPILGVISLAAAATTIFRTAIHR